MPGETKKDLEEFRAILTVPHIEEAMLMDKIVEIQKYMNAQYEVFKKEWLILDDPALIMGLILGVLLFIIVL